MGNQLKQQRREAEEETGLHVEVETGCILIPAVTSAHNVVFLAMAQVNPKPGMT